MRLTTDKPFPGITWRHLKVRHSTLSWRVDRASMLVVLGTRSGEIVNLEITWPDRLYRFLNKCD